MANLRLLRIKASDSTTIKAQFSHEIDPLLVKGNVEIHSNNSNIPTVDVLSIKIVKDVIIIKTKPMTPLASYYVEFKSIDGSKFKSKNGDAFLFEDGRTNKPLILGPENPENKIRDNLKNYLSNNIYNLDDKTVVSDVVNSQSTILNKALQDIGQAKNDNYLEVLIEDERKVRGEGPYDRLNEEGAFEVVRVGLRSTGSNLSNSFSFENFPSGPITLQRADISNEELIAGSGAGTFNNLILTVKNKPVSKLKSVIIEYQIGESAEYDISTYGYQIKDSTFDSDFAFTYLLLEDNQFRLSEQILETDLVPPGPGDKVYVSYEYRSLGRIIDENSVQVSQVLDAVREICPPLTTKFNLQHAPVVNENDNIPTSGGVSFLNPLSNPPFSENHPAFQNEIAFRLESLPSNFGDYAIDYENGTVYVYGEVKQDGTGNFSPVANYKYRKVFDSRIDYTYNPETYQLVASPLRELVGENLKISFDYEQTLVPGVDYVAQVHKEVLDERIENKLKSLNSLSVNNTPITNVFRVFNETSGEIYTVNRFTDDTIYFSFNSAPRILTSKRERAQFKDVLNELLLVSDELTNGSSVKIFKIPLQNNRIISNTEDVIGSSFNSSAVFSRTDIFEKELYFDGNELTLDQNIDRLSVGRYQIDYENGIVYLGVDNDQEYDLGTINYKSSFISPKNSHVISVSNIYHSLGPNKGINKSLNYSSFTEGEIVPTSFDYSDERYLNGDSTLSYINDSGSIEVSDDIKSIRFLFDAWDLNNNENPTNFASSATNTNNIVSLDEDGVQKSEILTIGAGSTIDVSFISAGAEIVSVSSVIRTSDQDQLWDDSGSFTGYTITLSGINSPSQGEEVQVIYNVQLNGGATPIIDYNRGDYFIDYNYLADEILVSYEYGDNVLDFRESNSINSGTEYFTTYKVGALRDALLKNFGTLVDIPILNSFDTTLNRELYRDALQAALQSFTKGPTIPAMKKIVSNITKIDPELIESIFEVWSLGDSHLYPKDINITGDLQLLSGKFDNGVLIENPDETITFPVSSNLRLESGSLGLWVIPEWDGLDNDATLTFSSIKKDGYIIAEDSIFIGADSHNPTFDLNGAFKINKNDEKSPVGLPSAIFTNTGVFIYYDDFEKLWKFLTKDSTDGYVYSGEILSSGEVYNVRAITDVFDPSDRIRTYSNKIEFEFKLDNYDQENADGYAIGDGYISGYSFDGISFMADDRHYLFDFGESNTNRFSLYKDGKGYLSFEVKDKGNKNKKHTYKVSADISDWSAGEKHFIGCSWRLNSSDRRDEMHLFIDGFEVPNIMRYGGRPISASTDRFRTVVPEIVVGTVPKKTILGSDLSTTFNSNTVFSNVNFQAEGIVAGDTIDILELGFESYIISTVNGNILTLNTTMPSTLDNARFSINKYSAIVSSEIDLASNIAVSILSSGEETEIPGLRADLPSYTISKNSSNQNVLTLLGNADVGDQILIRTLGLNHRRCRGRVFVWGDTTSVLRTQMPPPINLDEVKIFRVILPRTIIGLDNSNLVGSNFESDPLTVYEVSNSTEGRTLAVNINGNNVNFSTPATVSITGTTKSGEVNEVLSFSAPGIQNTTEQWRTISSVVVEVLPVDSSKDSVAIEIKEAYSITNPEDNDIFPVVRFSFKTQNGITLEGDGTSTISDENGVFTDSDVGNKLVISSPGSVAGTYTILSRIDENTITVSPTPGSFSDGIYDIYNVSIGRSGFQNGFFTLETAGQTNQDFPLKEGFYDFDYSSYLEIPFKPFSNELAYIGSDINGKNQAKAIIDEFRILSNKLTDVRIGESISSNQRSFTTDFTALKEFVPDDDTLLLLRFNSLPFINVAPFYKSATKEYIQSGESVNSNFKQSIMFVDKPLIVENKGYLSTASEGTIEFWVSPRFDTFNDPHNRFYFDASGSIVEEVVSTSKGVIKLNNSISSVLSVRLATDVNNTGIDYFKGGSIASDFKTINLGLGLPAQQTPVKVAYIPSGLSGDRISIYKDSAGFLNLTVRAQEIDYRVRQPIFWARDSWHRIKATFKFNSANNKDEIRLFVDGEERGLILFGTGLIFGTGAIFGQGLSGLDTTRLISDINFNDPINNFYLGSDYLSVNHAQARIDNFKISNIIQSPILVSGQAKDVNYSSNLNVVLPVVPDAFTTYLLDFDRLVLKTDDFAILRDEKFGIFNFTLNIIDSFGIVIENNKIRQVLENLISALKPAQSKATINFIE